MAARRPWSHWVVLVTGLLIGASSIPHAFVGWPSHEPALVAANVEREIVESLSAGWYFGSMAMVVFGAVAVLAFRGLPAAWPSAFAVGLGYLAFGTSALVLRGSSHFIGFIVLGAALAAGSFAARR